MEFDIQQNFQEDNDSENINQNIKDSIIKYLRYWKWFIVSLIICLLFTLYKLNFIVPQYKATATIKIEEEKNGNNSTLSVFQDLEAANLRSNQKIEDEIEILKSKDLISEVIKSLKTNVRLFTNKNGLSKFLDNNFGLNTEFYQNDEYKSMPLKVNFFVSDSILYNTRASFIIYINSINSFTYVNHEKSIEKRYNFGEKLNTHFGEIIITPNVDLKKNNWVGTNMMINVIPVKSLASSYAEQILIEPTSDFSTILSLTIKDGVKNRAQDFLTELVVKYNERAILLKEQLSKSTSDFVQKRLEIISNDLSVVDLTAETLKTRYKLTDAGSDVGYTQQSGQAIESQIVQTQTELEKIGYIKDYVATKGENDLIPVEVGVADNNVSTTIKQFNNLMLEKQRFLKNSTDKNPIVVNINEQLKTLKDNINQGLNNIESSQKISLDALNIQDRRINSRLYSAPKQERQIRDVRRQQQIKETLYLYLLQKREETAITLGVIDPNAKIINSAESTSFPVSPNKNIYYLAALFAGILIPFIIIFIRDFLDTKVKSREEIQNLLNIPILGDIPKLDTKKNYLLTKDDHSSPAEAFRILRTNLSFFLTNSQNKKGKTIFITSTIANEGKSFVASNIATSLAHAGKKTLLIGMDIRAPRIKSYLGIRGTKGVTNYIVDKNLAITDITLKVPKVENLDLISSGDIAPNPAELLMNPRVNELFDAAKEAYEYVIVDTAASSIITDTTIIRGYADAFIFVIRANYLEKKQLKYIKAVYKDKILPNLALLINGVDTKKGYGYGYGYGANFEKSKSKPWWKLKAS